MSLFQKWNNYLISLWVCVESLRRSHMTYWCAAYLCPGHTSRCVTEWLHSMTMRLLPCAGYSTAVVPNLGSPDVLGLYNARSLRHQLCWPGFLGVVVQKIGNPRMGTTVLLYVLIMGGRILPCSSDWTILFICLLPASLIVYKFSSFSAFQVCVLDLRK